MDPQEYRTIYNVEDRHWWYVGMRQITMALLEETYGHHTDLRILDAGSGTGAAMGYLSRFGQVTGVDLSPLALAFCRKRQLERLGQASVTALPFAAASFDLVTSFDVLYHRAVGDPRIPLAEFYRVLSPGGRVLLRLPAYDRLRGHHDIIIHTARRFSASQLGRDLETVGFTVERLTYANTLLFPITLARRLLDPLLPHNDTGNSDVIPNPAWLDDALTAVLGLEASWLRQHDLPFGLTVAALATK